MAVADEKGGVILHFGLPKTGSSSIQQSLAQHLNDARFHYVNLGNPNASTAVATMFKAEPASFHLHAKRNANAEELESLRDRFRRRLRRELRKARGRTAIISAEAASGLDEAELHRLCEVVAEQGGAVTAVGYVRDPRGYMESTFQQQVRGGDDCALVEGARLDYRARIEKFDNVLGRDHVRLWQFDPLQFPDGCVVQDFCNRLGISFNRTDVVRANEGLPLPALKLLYAYRRFGPGYGSGPTAVRENVLLIQQLRDCAGPKLRLHAELVDPLVEGQRDEIEWVESRLGRHFVEPVGAGDESAIHSEDDLLDFAPDSLQWLADQLGPDRPVRYDSGTPECVAEWMHRLRQKLAMTDDKIRRIRERKPGTP